MPVIAGLTVIEFRFMIDRFNQKYVDHWNSWLKICDDRGKKVTAFGRILRSWRQFVRMYCSLTEAAPPRFTQLHNGRIYDMALGPGG